MVIVAVAIALLVAIVLAGMTANRSAGTNPTSGLESPPHQVAPNGPVRTWPNWLSAIAGVFVGFCGMVCVGTAAGLGVAGAKFASKPMILVFAVLELGVVLLLAAWARRVGGRGFLRGLIIGASLALLLSAACWGIMSFSYPR